jgi:hypothetical protein
MLFSCDIDQGIIDVGFGMFCMDKRLVGAFEFKYECQHYTYHPGQIDDDSQQVF